MNLRNIGAEKRFWGIIPYINQFLVYFLLYFKNYARYQKMTYTKILQ